MVELRGFGPHNTFRTASTGPPSRAHPRGAEQGCRFADIPGARPRCNEPLRPALAAYSSPASGRYFLRVSHRIAEPTVRGRPMTMATPRANATARA